VSLLTYGKDAAVIVNVYIDGLNLFYGCLKGTPYKWLDLDAFARRLLPSDEIKRIRYFTTKINERPNNPGAAQRQETYLRALNTMPHMTIHFGHFLTSTVRMPLAQPQASGPRTVNVIKTEEKGSDVNLATYLLIDAFRRDCEAQVVMTNDSDLCEPIRIVRDELHIPVGVVNPHRASRRSRALRGTFFKQVRPATVASCQLPPKMSDHAGEFSRPADW
jgi:hypothetical protein